MIKKVRQRAERIGRNMTLSPRSEAWLTELADLTGVARGRIVDLALLTVEACVCCSGRGTLDGPLGPDTVCCPECKGARVVQTCQ